MLSPKDLFISREVFLDLVFKAEEEFLREREKTGSREACVQIWLDVCEEIVPIEYIEELENSYKLMGWKNVEIRFIEDRGTKLYIYLSL